MDNQHCTSCWGVMRQVPDVFRLFVVLLGVFLSPSCISRSLMSSCPFAGQLWSAAAHCSSKQCSPSGSAGCGSWWWAITGSARRWWQRTSDGEEPLMCALQVTVAEAFCWGCKKSQESALDGPRWADGRSPSEADSCVLFRK
jgi:hypothetical protein